jgi:hypothetical protein
MATSTFSSGVHVCTPMSFIGSAHLNFLCSASFWTLRSHGSGMDGAGGDAGRGAGGVGHVGGGATAPAFLWAPKNYGWGLLR